MWGHGSSVPHVKIVGINQQLNQARTMFRLFEQQENKNHDWGSSHLLINIRDCNMRQFSDSSIVASPSVGYGNGVHSWSAEDGIIGMPDCQIMANEYEKEVCQNFILILPSANSSIFLSFSSKQLWCKLWLTMGIPNLSRFLTHHCEIIISKQ